MCWQIISVSHKMSLIRGYQESNANISPNTDLPSIKEEGEEDGRDEAKLELQATENKQSHKKNIFGAIERVNVSEERDHHFMQWTNTKM